MTATGSPDCAPLKNVRIERRGGLAGLHVNVDLDYAAFTAAQCRALDKVVEENDAPTVAISARSAPAGADRFSYRIHLTHADGQERAIDVPEDGLPAALAGLVKSRLP